MNAKILLAASLTLAASSALAQEVQRAGKGEFYLSPARFPDWPDPLIIPPLQNAVQ